MHELYYAHHVLGRIAAYPKSRSDELSADHMRAIARDALSVHKSDPCKACEMPQCRDAGSCQHPSARPQASQLNLDYLREMGRLEARIRELEQASAAVVDAVGGDEPVAWMYTDRFGTHFTDEKDEWEIAEGIESVQPLYARPQASAAVPDAVMAERHRIYAALEADPSALWRDQGFQGWRRKRGENTDS